ncbi:cilia- and flagella-associated protein 107 [Pezoporus wallicus]|uniref:cilia- and flagella-associated protein 107 n=1 Tax=Pezoporus wallicus TaxID=35540 RepID=UPI00254FE9A1|nr:cilia- and flagella-associated protein 107 [Pezoporus wallicus]XP_061335359.1 cilia- and flagella-associated protein 107 [Pezoporus flaviventris]
MLLRRRHVIASQNDGQDSWKIEPRYSTKVLIGNWLEDRKRERSSPVEFRKDTGELNHSIYRKDFVSFPDHKPDQTLRRAMVQKMEGLPRQHCFTHHEEPRNRNLVSEYDDKYNRHSYNPVLPPLRNWSGPKSSWIPQKSDFPITEPPTNYGLLEHLMKKWHKKEARVMNRVYTTSYETLPIPAFATHHRRRPPKTPVLPFIQGSPPQNVSGILDYERLRNICKSSADW